MKLRLLAGLAGVLFVVLLLPKSQPAAPVEDYHMAMGTVVRMALFVDADRAPALFERARAEMARLDRELTRFGEGGELVQVSRDAGLAPVPVSAELAQLLGASIELSRRTGGAFDPALGALTALWGFPDATRPPTPAQVDSARTLSGVGLVRLEDGRVRFDRDGVRLDLGGCAKGYVVDRAVALLCAAGVEAGVVDAGGNLRFWGEKPDGRPWRFGVQHPRQAERIVPVEDVGLAALATSGDYEQFFEYEGRRYHHLLDPATGYPSRRAVSATVWARSAMEADVLSTASFVAGPDSALAWAAAMDSVEVLVYYERDGALKRVASRGLEGRLETDHEPELTSR